MTSILRCSVLTFLLAATPAWGDLPWHVSIDVSSLTFQDIELEFALYDNSEVLGDSWALIDNVVLHTTTVDFETAALEGFDDSLNPASVDAVLGNLDGSGSYLMRLDEDPSFNPTFAFRDFAGSSATSLEFDLHFLGSETSGQFGLDELVVSILDPITLNPLLTGLTTGFADVLAINADGLTHTAQVTAVPVPVPGAAVLAVLGLGCVGLVRRQRGG